MKSLFLILALGLGMQSLGAQALGANAKYLNKLDRELSGQGYGMAGCGPGSLLFGERKGWTQVFAATTNAGTLQSVSLTLGTSNCPPLESQPTAHLNEFIEINRQALEVEAAHGGGSTIATLSHLLYCPSQFSLGSKLKGQFENIFGGDPTSSGEVSRKIIKLTKTCREVSS